MSKKPGKKPSSEKKDYNLRLAWLKPTKNGNMTSKSIDDDMYDAIQQIEPGGKFFIKQLTDEDGEEYAALEYMSKDKVDAYKASLPPLETKGSSDNDSL